jgi:hypothetical protein
MKHSNHQRCLTPVPLAYRTFTRIITAALLALLLIGSSIASAAPGAIFTTDSNCTGTNVNIFGNKADVYLDGGPHHPGSAGLPDGGYYVQVTEPNGTVLGVSTDATGVPVTAVTVVAGEFSNCYQLSAILRTASSGFTVFGYDSTSNPGGEYKVWVSSVPTFANSDSKTDNFKVKEGPVPPETAELCVEKFYDANANGIADVGEVLIDGWKMRISDGISLIRFTPTCNEVEPDTYSVFEFNPIETNWIHTTPQLIENITLAANEHKTVFFGNVCLGPGGGKTLGFWSNKNGQATMNDGGTLAPELALLSSLNLRNGSGADFNPTNYNDFRNWLLNANATNMAYMLSAQLAAMQLNVESGGVGGNAVIYAPALLPFAPAGLSALGFIKISDLITAANNELGLHGSVLSGNPFRAYQEALKNALDAANNNLNFVQAAPCPFTFAD